MFYYVRSGFSRLLAHFDISSERKDVCEAMKQLNTKWITHYNVFYLSDLQVLLNFKQLIPSAPPNEYLLQRK